LSGFFAGTGVFFGCGLVRSMLKGRKTGFSSEFFDTGFVINVQAENES
jgi:hypothetical protein